MTRLLLTLFLAARITPIFGAQDAAPRAADPARPPTGSKIFTLQELVEVAGRRGIEQTLPKRTVRDLGLSPGTASKVLRLSKSQTPDGIERAFYIVYEAAIKDPTPKAQALVWIAVKVTRIGEEKVFEAWTFMTGLDGSLRRVLRGGGRRGAPHQREVPMDQAVRELFQREQRLFRDSAGVVFRQ